MARADVVILGGGIIGCALAEELARKGQRVLVIERSRIGAEASSAAAGILSSQLDLEEPGPLFELCQAARRLYPSWAAHLERRSGLRVGYHRDGIVYLATTRRDAQVMEARVRWQRWRGLRIDSWRPAELRRREPAVDGRIVGAFFFPDDAQVDNVRLMAALACACRQAGVRLRERTMVRRVLVRGGRALGVETDRGRVTARVVVNCLGSWASLGGVFPVGLPVQPARGQLLMFQAPQRLLRHAVMSDRGYMVQRRDGRLLLGSTVEFAGFEKAVTVQGMQQIVSGIRRLSSRLDDCSFLEAWAGFRPYTKTQHPIMGSTSIEGLYVATGHFRHGILLAPVTATLMAELILRGDSSFDLAPFAPPTRPF